jgi:multicomponent Na+:H+ antiporter subunit B
MALLTLLAVATIAIVRQRSLLGVVILAGIYSFLMASLLIALDAVDVAMTEASVGAGISTVLLLATLHLVKATEMRPIHANWVPLLVALVVGGIRASACRAGRRATARAPGSARATDRSRSGR